MLGNCVVAHFLASGFGGGNAQLSFFFEENWPTSNKYRDLAAPVSLYWARDTRMRLRQKEQNTQRRDFLHGGIELHDSVEFLFSFGIGFAMIHDQWWKNIVIASMVWLIRDWFAQLLFVAWNVKKRIICQKIILLTWKSDLTHAVDACERQSTQMTHIFNAYFEENFVFLLRRWYFSLMLWSIHLSLFDVWNGTKTYSLWTMACAIVRAKHVRRNTHSARAEFGLARAKYVQFCCQKLLFAWICSGMLC